MWKTSMQFDFNLEFGIQKFRQETQKQVTHDSKLAYLPFCINNHHSTMCIAEKIKMNSK